jgi:hypothetical protein
MDLMREGVGVEASLCWVAARFAQRAVEDFFEGSQHREFVIDAAAAVEFAAKAVVARHDVNELYELRKGTELTDAQRLVLNPSLGPDDARPIGEAREAAMQWLLQNGRTISGTKALTLASRRTSIDAKATANLFKARNAAVHLGDIDSLALDGLAHDFLHGCVGLWAGLPRNESDLWGDLAPIADVKFMTSDRTPEDDAKVRVIRSRRHWHASGISANRRSRLDFAEANEQCPSCHQAALVSTQPMGSAPELCVPEHQRQSPVDVLDCPSCGLTLFGTTQIDWARRAYPPHVSQPWNPIDAYR